MKVVHVSDCFLPRLGGIEVQVAELSRMQSAAGHEVAVVTATPDRLAAGHEPPYAIHRLTAGLPWELPVDPHAGPRLQALFAELRPDVVHVHVGAVSPFGWAAARCAASGGWPTTVTVHSMWDPLTSAGYRTLDRLSGWTRWGMVITAVSAAAARPIRRVTGDRAPVHVVANGIDVEQWRLPVTVRGGSGEPPYGDAGGSGGGRVRVAAVGRLAPRKGPVALLRLLREAADGLPRGLSLEATIVGEGPGRPAMERYLRRHRMSYVELTGRLDRTRVREVLARSDVFLAPARRESFGLAALEARTAGLPVVALACSGVADFVRPGKEGLLGRTRTDLAEAITRLATDPALRHGIAAHNRRTTPQGCTWPEVLEAFEKRYAEAVAG